jgi:LPXTG-motif cell wall-anchored protein
LTSAEGRRDRGTLPPPRRALVAAAGILVADGVVGLYLGGLLGPLGALLALGGLAVALVRHQRRERSGEAPALDRGLVLAAVAATVIDFMYLAASLLDGFVHLLLVLVLLRLFTGRTARELRDAGLLSFFMLVAAAAVTFTVAFVVVVAVFLVVGTWMLMLYHVEAEAIAAPEPPAPGLGPPLFGLALAAAAATILITATFFVVIPRVGQAALPLRAQLRRMVTGFTDRVELGAIGEIESDGTVVMRVRITDGWPTPEQVPILRWRGMTLDHFDGRTWTASRGPRAALRPSPTGQVDVARPRLAQPLVTQEIFLDPIATDVIFVAPRAIRVRVRAGPVIVDDAGALSVPVPAARLHYTVDSELDPIVLGAPRRAPELPSPAESARALQLPPMSDRIGDLARRVTAGAHSDAERAARLTDFLSREFQYTLRLDRRGDGDPLEEFLFDRRAGNCEYFASALAIMLRTLGIPARVVNGFQRGEWNPYGDYFAVRLSDAHSWVEAWLAGHGWVALDPSPRGPAAMPAAYGRAGLYLDALRMRWYRWVVNWSLQDQIALGASARRVAVWPAKLPGTDRGSIVLAVAGATLLVAGAYVWSRRRRTGAAGGAALPARMPDFYREALRCVRRAGLRPASSETAGEFATRVAGARPELGPPFQALTHIYERVRFGGAVPTPSETAAVTAAAAALRRASEGLAASGRGAR